MNYEPSYLWSRKYQLEQEIAERERELERINQYLYTMLNPDPNSEACHGQPHESRSRPIAPVAHPSPVLPQWGPASPAVPHPSLAPNDFYEVYPADPRPIGPPIPARIPEPIPPPFHPGYVVDSYRYAANPSFPVVTVPQIPIESDSPLKSAYGSGAIGQAPDYQPTRSGGRLPKSSSKPSSKPSLRPTAKPSLKPSLKPSSKQSSDFFGESWGYPLFFALMVFLLIVYVAFPNRGTEPSPVSDPNQANQPLAQ